MTAPAANATSKSANAAAGIALPDAAAVNAQAVLLQGSWKFDKRACTLRSMQKAIDAASQNIVAVEGVWDNRSGSWSEASPVAVVMEKCTVVLAPVDDFHLAATVMEGTVSPRTASTVAATDAASGPSAEGETRQDRPDLCLRPLPFCQFATGLHVSSFAFGTCTEGLLTCVEARFSDGGRLTLGAKGPQLQRASRRTAYPKAASGRHTEQPRSPLPAGVPRPSRIPAISKSPNRTGAQDHTTVAATNRRSTCINCGKKQARSASGQTPVYASVNLLGGCSRRPHIPKAGLEANPSLLRSKACSASAGESAFSRGLRKNPPPLRRSHDKLFSHRL